MTTCDVCGGTMTVDRTSGDPVCLRCARVRADERAWRDGIAQARAMLAGRR